MFGNVIEKFGKTRTFLVFGFIVFIFLAAWAGLLTGSRSMVPLYTALSNADKYDIVRLLNQIGAEYSLTDDSVLVDVQKVREYRMYLAAEGVPLGGSIVGYEIFNKEDTFSTSSFTQNVNLIRALEGEISRTIMSFEHIRMARVHLAIPKKEPFSREKTEPSASVILKLRKNSSLTKKEADAISNFIASAVPGLKPDNVTIVSTDGKALKLRALDDEVSFANHEYKLEVEKHFKNVIEDLLGKSIGYGKIKAQVSVDLDFDRVVTNSETYDPSGQALRSTQSVEEHSKSTSQGGNVSVGNNIPGGGASGDGSSGSAADKTDEISNYEISKEEKKYMKSVGSIKRMSIAVLVDGSYKTDEANGSVTYIPRNSDDLIQIRSLVVSAIGFDAARGDRIEVINMQFLKDAADEKEPARSGLVNMLLYQADRILIVSVIFIFSVLFSFFVLKPIVMKILDKRASVLDAIGSIDVGKSRGVGGAEGDNTNQGKVADSGEMDDTAGAKKVAEGRQGGVDEATQEGAQSSTTVKSGFESQVALSNELNRLVEKNVSHAATLLRRLIRESQ